MNITADMSFLATVWLVFIRLSTLFLMSPLFLLGQIPARIKTLILLPLALALVVSTKVNNVEVPASLPFFFVAAVHEVFIGALMAFGVFAAFAAFSFGGRILDFQMGFGVANLIDPSTNAQSPLLGTMLTMVAVMTFYLLDGHHLLIRGLAYSLEQVPPGTALTETSLAAIVAQFGLMFVYGMAIVAPAVFALLMLDVGMAVAARTMPQVNMFIVGLPLKIFVGLVMLTVSLNFISPLLQKIYRSIFEFWEAVLV